jgi:hypothetical protein
LWRQKSSLEKCCRHSLTPISHEAAVLRDHSAVPGQNRADLTYILASFKLSFTNGSHGTPTMTPSLSTHFCASFETPMFPSETAAPCLTLPPRISTKRWLTSSQSCVVQHRRSLPSENCGMRGPHVHCFFSPLCLNNGCSDHTSTSQSNSTVWPRRMAQTTKTGLRKRVRP